MNVDNVLQFKRKEEPKEWQEFTAMLGEIEFNDPFQKDVDFEVRCVIAPSSSRFWIVVEGDTAEFFPFHNLNKCFMPGTQDQVVRQWVRDSIQQHYGKARVTVV